MDEMEAFKFSNEKFQGAGNSWQNYTLFWAMDRTISKFTLHGTRCISDQWFPKTSI
jgi:hypothetical protein